MNKNFCQSQFCDSRFSKVGFDVALSTLTTFKIGGNASCVLDVCSIAEIDLALNIIKKNNLQFFVLGRGSNVLAKDEGFEGVILHLGSNFSDIWMEDGLLLANAGASAKSVSAFACEREFGGCEFFSTIPASVGGAVCMNAGCFGFETKDVVHTVWATNGTKNVCFSQQECEFEYRNSIFQTNDFVITKVGFKLPKTRKEISMALAKDLGNAKKMSQPLNFSSAGSIFKCPKGYFAGQLIEQAGLKGLRIGGAEVSTKHAGFIVNWHQATCEDVLKLIKIVQSQVAKKFGVNLFTEVKLLGEKHDTGRFSYTHLL